MASTYYEAFCNITDDLQVIEPNLNSYNVRRALEGFVQSSGIVYKVGGTGYVSVLYRDGQELGSAQSSSSDVDSDSEWFYDEDADLLFVASALDPATEHFYEAGLDWKTTKTEAVNRASAFIREFVNKPIRRLSGDEGTESTGTYQDIIVKCASHLAVATIIKPYDFEKAMRIEGVVYNEETNTGLLNLIKAGEIPLWDETTDRQKSGIIKRIAYNASSTGGIVDVYMSNNAPYVDFDKVKVVISDDGNSGSGANFNSGSVNTAIKYSVYTKNDDGLKVDQVVTDEPLNGGYQTLAYGVFIRFAVSSTASGSSAKYYTNDEWEISLDGKPIESGSGIKTLQAIRTDY
jgi:hypothetical protein